MRPTLTADTDFIFLKLLFQDVSCYAKFRQFVLGQDHDLVRMIWNGYYKYSNN